MDARDVVEAAAGEADARRVDEVFGMKEDEVQRGDRILGTVSS
jgi:hypothetical protein